MAFYIGLLKTGDAVFENQKAAVRFFPDLDDDFTAVLPSILFAVDYGDQFAGGDVFIGY